MLIYARDLIKAGWTKGSSARTRTGKEVSSNSKEAARFCMLGAVNKASVIGCDTATRGFVVYIDLCNILRRFVPNSNSLHKFNDQNTTTKKDVLLVFDQAIAKEKTNDINSYS